MKKVILACVIVLSASFLTAQSYNPYVKQGVISPLLPWQLNGNGLASFEIGNQGSAALPMIPKKEMILKITLSDGIPDVQPLNTETAMTALEGTWATMFTWSYNISTNTYTGKQNQVIPAQSQGSVTIRYKVTVNSSQGTPANGFNVNITPPPYTNGINTTNDDAVSSYTFAKAIDYGDAPASYGRADHIIDVENPANSIYLGTTVDYDLEDQPSAHADADDVTGLNDEDGVTFPTLVIGTTVTIPVVVTATGNSNGFISAWIDWNGDGSFTDAGEQVTENVLVTSSGTINLTGIQVPENAVSSSPTFVRFRIGPANMNSTGTYSFGEVEDYQVQMLNPNIGIDDKEGTRQLIIYSNENNIYVKDLTGSELKGKMRVYNLVGQRVAKKSLTGGTLNKFSMNVEEGYYIVEVVEDEITTHGKVFLKR